MSSAASSSGNSFLPTNLERRTRSALRAPLLLLAAFFIPAVCEAPGVVLRLVPAAFTEIDLCGKPCSLKAYWVTEYKWEQVP